MKEGCNETVWEMVLMCYGLQLSILFVINYRLRQVLWFYYIKWYELVLAGEEQRDV